MVLMRQILGGWKTGCTVRKSVRSSLPGREVMASMNLSLLLVFLCMVWRRDKTVLFDVQLGGT